MLTSQSLQLRVGVDIGAQSHAVAVGLTDGRLLEAFEIPHTAAGFEDEALMKILVIDCSEEIFPAVHTTGQAPVNYRTTRTEQLA
jgi:hypothetical protein